MEKNFFRYFPHREVPNSYSVNVIGAGKSIVRPGESYPPSTHPSLYNFNWNRGRTLPEFQILLILDGKGQFESEKTGLIEFESPALIVLIPGVWHRYRPLPDSGWTERWLSFDGELAYQMFNIPDSGRQLTITSPDEDDSIFSEFDQLLDYISEESNPNIRLISLRAMKLIAEAAARRAERQAEKNIVAKIPSQNPGSDDPIVNDALTFIWSHSNGPIAVSDVAKHLPVTRRTLDRRFSEVVGHSVLEEIVACRMSRAKRLLIATDLPVKKVAQLAGFSSSERMRVAFVDGEGMPPHTYRQENSIIDLPKQR